MYNFESLKTWLLWRIQRKKKKTCETIRKITFHDSYRTTFMEDITTSECLCHPAASLDVFSSFDSWKRLVWIHSRQTILKVAIFIIILAAFIGSLNSWLIVCAIFIQVSTKIFYLIDYLYLVESIILLIYVTFF